MANVSVAYLAKVGFAHYIDCSQIDPLTYKTYQTDHVRSKEDPSLTIEFRFRGSSKTLQYTGSVALEINMVFERIQKMTDMTEGYKKGHYAQKH